MATTRKTAAPAPTVTESIDQPVTDSPVALAATDEAAEAAIAAAMGQPAQSVDLDANQTAAAQAEISRQTMLEIASLLGLNLPADTPADVVKALIQLRNNQALLNHADKQARLAEEEDTRSEIERIRDEQMALKRVVIQPLSPHLIKVPGVIRTMQNKIVGQVSHVVLFGEPTQDGWHLPSCLIDNLREAEHMQIVEVRNGGSSSFRPRRVKSFSIVELPPLTKEELDAIRQAQMAAA